MKVWGNGAADRRLRFTTPTCARAGGAAARSLSRSALCQHELNAAKPFGARARRTYRLLRIEQACDLPMPVGSLTNLRIERIPM